MGTIWQVETAERIHSPYAGHIGTKTPATTCQFSTGNGEATVHSTISFMVGGPEIEPAAVTPNTLLLHRQAPAFVAKLWYTEPCAASSRCRALGVSRLTLLWS